MKFRVYRLPGSQRVWHVDTGANTKIVNILAFMSDVPVKTMKDEFLVPRAWIEIEGHLFVDRAGIGKFVSEQSTLLRPDLDPYLAAEKLAEQLSDEDLEKLTRPDKEVQ